MSEILRFFQALYPEPFDQLVMHDGDEPPRLVIWTLAPKHSTARSGSRSAWAASLEEAVTITLERRDDEHVFFGVALQNPREALRLARATRPDAPLQAVRGRADSAVVLPAFWVDLDVAGPGHASDTLPPTLNAARALLQAVPLEPSILVRTGSGLHAYWLLDEPWVLETPEERAEARLWVRRLQQTIRDLAAEHGWRVDGTADLPRVLRVPGTFNHKSLPPKPVVIESLHPERRYHPQDFDLLPPLDDPQPATTPEDPDRPPDAKPPDPRPPDSRPPDSRTPDYGPPADFTAVWEGCSFIRHCHQQQETLPYDWWFAMLTIVARCQAPGRDGVELCHQMSRRYAKYTPAETDAKIAQVLEPPGGPTTCAKIAEMGADKAHCNLCPHPKAEPRVKSPIVLGRRNPRHGSSAPPAPTIHHHGNNGNHGSGNHGNGNGNGNGDSTDRPRIVITTREHEVADQALAVLAERERNLFRRGGALVQVVAGGGDVDELATRPHRSPEAPAARPLLEARLRELLANHCELVRTRQLKNSVEHRPAHPPSWLSRALISRPDWPTLPRLEGVVEGPVLRPDGSVLQTPGYDRASGLFLAPNTDFEPVPERPTEAQTEEALLRLSEAVCDFPFANPAHFSAWLASLLTPLARFAFAGPAPVLLIDANVRGAGKSLLADVCHLIVTGRPAARMPYTRDEAELRKQVTSIALKARQLVVIDNVTGAFGNPTLDLVFTASHWADRLLGQNTDLELPLSVTWYVTGNNIELRGDMPRRCLHVRLETSLEKPEHRSGFRHPRLLEWLATERRRLLPAALTLLAAYRAAGQPASDLRPWGSFEGWSDWVRGTVTWLGLDDPADTCEALASADAGTSARERLLEGLDEVISAHGDAATVHQILQALDSHDGRTRYETLCTALAEIFPRLKAGELPTPVQLGRKLRSLRGRVIGGRCAVPIKKSSKGVLWAIERSS